MPVFNKGTAINCQLSKLFQKNVWNICVGHHKVKVSESKQKPAMRRTLYHLPESFYLDLVHFSSLRNNRGSAVTQRLPESTIINKCFLYAMPQSNYGIKLGLVYNTMQKSQLNKMCDKQVEGGGGHQHIHWNFSGWE